VRNAAGLELLGILAAHADSEDQSPARQHVEGRRDLGRDGGMAKSEQVDAHAQLDATGDAGIRGEQGQ